MRLSAILFVVGVLLVGLLAGGCYTVLRHPTGEVVDMGGATYRSCADCHADATYYHPYYLYGRSSARWSGYYGQPWWYYDYWWYPDDHDDHDDHDGHDGHDEMAPPVEEGTRHLWGSSGWASGGWGFHKPANEPAVKNPPEADESKPPADNKDEEKPKKDEGDRNLWKEKKKGF